MYAHGIRVCPNLPAGKIAWYPVRDSVLKSHYQYYNPAENIQNLSDVVGYRRSKMAAVKPHASSPTEA
jgi:hypothetical protein